MRYFFPFSLFILLLFQVGANTNLLGQTSSELLIRGHREAADLPVGGNYDIVEVEKASSKQNLKTLLQNYPGLYISSNPSQGGGDQLSLRGFAQKQLEIMVDGVPLQGAGMSAADLKSIPLDIVDKIIISRGPIYHEGFEGGRQMGGSLNILTKKRVKKTKVKGRTGSFGTKEFFGQTFYNEEDTHTQMYLYQKKRKGDYTFDNPKKKSLYRNAASQPQKLRMQNNDMSDWGVGIGVNKKNSSIYPYKFDVSFRELERGIPGRIGHFFKRVREREDEKKLRGEINGSKRGRVWAWSFYATENDKKYSDHEGEYTGSSEVVLRKSRRWGLGLKSMWAQTFGGMDWDQTVKLNYGGENYREQDLNRERQLYSALTKWDGSITEDLGASFFGKLSSLGLEQNNITYGASLAYQLINEIKLETNIHTGLRRPSMDELYLSRGLFTGNKNLRAEKTVGGDVAFTYRQTRNFFKVSYFQYKLDDLIHNILASGFQYRPYNFEQAQTQGLEFSLKLELLENLHWEGALTYQKMEFHNPANGTEWLKVPGKPALYGGNRLHWDVNSKVSFYGDFSFAKKRYANRANTKKLEDRFETQLGGSFKAKKFLLSGEITNLFDKQNYDVRGFPLEGRAFYGSLTRTF